MARGGKRQGAGRKLGSLTKRTQEIAAQATAEGITPLEVMVKTMRARWDAKDMDGALAAAAQAAPYIHPRLAATTLKGDKDNPLETVVRDERFTFEKLRDEFRAAADPSGDDPGVSGSNGAGGAH